MTLVLDIPEQKLQEATAAAQARGKTLQQTLEEYVDTLSRQNKPSDWQQLSDQLPNIPELTEEDIAAEIKSVRSERRNRRRGNLSGVVNVTGPHYRSCTVNQPASRLLYNWNWRT